MIRAISPVGLEHAERGVRGLLGHVAEWQARRGEQAGLGAGLVHYRYVFSFSWK